MFAKEIQISEQRFPDFNYDNNNPKVISDDYRLHVVWEGLD